MATTAALLTGAQYDTLPYEEARPWELIEGELVEVPCATAAHQKIVKRILIALDMHIQASGARAIVLSDAEFAMAENIRVRPDVWVIAGELSETFDESKSPIPGAPDIAIEVISPSERTANSMRKVKVYLAHGTQEVWQVHPETQEVFVYRDGKVATEQTLTTPLLPGFQLAVATLFLR